MTEGLEFESRYGQEFSLLRVVQTGFGVHPTSYPMGTGVFFPGGKATGAGHSPPASAEVKKMWICTSTLPIRLHGVVLNWLSTGITLPFTLPLTSIIKICEMHISCYLFF
jgi:hypothetical protein